MDRGLASDIRQELDRTPVFTKNNLNNIHPYPAKMVANIPSVIIPHFSKPGDIILDPFCGSGTVLLEAISKDRNAIGTDINPLAVLISKVKTTKLNVAKVNELKEKILLTANHSKHISAPYLSNMDFWFTKTSQVKLGNLLYEIKKIKEPEYRNFFLLCLSSCIRYSSRADPDIVPPVISRKMRIGLKSKKRKILKKFDAVVTANINKIKYLHGLNTRTHSVSFINDVRNLNIPNESIDLVLTSPPYISAQKYPRSLKLELFWTELINESKFHILDKSTIGTERTGIREATDFNAGSKKLSRLLTKVSKISSERYAITAKYFMDMKEAISEVYRVLKPESYFVLLIGENTVCGIKFPNAKILSEYAEKTGFSLVASINDRIKSFGFMTKRNKTASIISTEKLLIFKK